METNSKPPYRLVADSIREKQAATVAAARHHSTAFGRAFAFAAAHPIRHADTCPFVAIAYTMKG